MQGKAISADEFSTEIQKIFSFATNKKFDEAILASDELLRCALTGEQTAKVYSYRVVAYNFHGDNKNALINCNVAINFSPSSANLYWLRGFINKELGNLPDTLDDFAESLVMNSKDEIPKRRLIGTIKVILKNTETEREILVPFLAKWKGQLPAGIVREFLFEQKKIKDFSEYWGGCANDFGVEGHFINARTSVLDKYKGSDNSSMIQDALDKVLDSVKALYLKLRVTDKDFEGKDGKKGIYLYQYAPYATLSNMASDKRLWLTPACYQNDPEEGCFFFEFLNKTFSRTTGSTENRGKIEVLCKSVYEEISDGKMNGIVFIRSLSPYEDKLLMWNSSYGENCKGVSVGIPFSTIHKISEAGSSLQKGKPKLNDILHAIPEQSKVEDSKFPGLPLEYVKCCRVLYLPDGDEQVLSTGTEKRTKSKDAELEKITKDTVNMQPPQYHHVEKELSDIFASLDELLTEISKARHSLLAENFDKDDLLRIFLPIAHLVKNNTYQHEKEFRLMFVADVFKGEKVETFVKPDHPFLHIETEPVLFMSETESERSEPEIVYVGPLCTEVDRLKAEHMLKYKCKIGVRPSTVKFR